MNKKYKIEVKKYTTEVTIGDELHAPEDVEKYVNTLKKEGFEAHNVTGGIFCMRRTAPVSNVDIFETVYLVEDKKEG